CSGDPHQPGAEIKRAIGRLRLHPASRSRLHLLSLLSPKRIREASSPESLVATRGSGGLAASAGRPRRLLTVTTVGRGHGRAPLQALAVAGQGQLEQAAGLPNLGESCLDVAKLALGKRSPAVPATTFAYESSHLVDREAGVAEQPDDGHSLKDRRIEATTAAHPDDAAEEAGLFIEAERRRAKPCPLRDLTDGQQIVGHALDFKCT